jgi:hypothetical protein
MNISNRGRLNWTGRLSEGTPNVPSSRVASKASAQITLIIIFGFHRFQGNQGIRGAAMGAVLHCILVNRPALSAEKDIADGVGSEILFRNEAVNQDTAISAIR